MSIAKNIDFLKQLPNASSLISSDALAVTATAQRLAEVRQFGGNPGNLRLFVHVPEHRPRPPALVVVLHGCAQNAAAYDLGSGWSHLADRYGFVLLMPQQRRSNNANLCFNWFVPDDVSRDRGEAASIRQMIEYAAHEYKIDRKCIFITGLSAGGGMTSAMLAAYPETFAGGAIIAGVPHGVADNLQDALKTMYKAPHIPAKELGRRVRAASAHNGAWPRVSVWHGSADSTVHPTNADHIVNQWLDIHGLPTEPMFEDVIDGHPRQGWWDADGRTIVESYLIEGMSHGAPLHSGAEYGSRPGPFMIDAGISSAFHIATFWGLTGKLAPAKPQAVPLAAAAPRKDSTRVKPRVSPPKPAKPSRINGVIDRALGAVGLKKPE